MLDATSQTDRHACVFCTRQGQPAILTETSALYAIPDKFPMVPGHVLIIAREHLRCYALGGDDLWPELHRMTDRMRRFLEETYGRAVLIWENGISGQSVFHAHLHLLPFDLRELPPGILEHPDVTPAQDWQVSVRACLARHNGYRYVELSGQRFTIVPTSPVIATVRQLLAAGTGLRWGEHGWIKTVGVADIQLLQDHWVQWVAINRRPSEGVS